MLQRSTPSLLDVFVATAFLLVGACFLASRCSAEEPAEIERVSEKLDSFINKFCLDCHSSSDASETIDLESIVSAPITEHLAGWEKVVKKLRSGQMPPIDAERPDASLLEETVQSLERSLDDVSVRHPQPGRTETFRRLTRFEYQNAIRDLLALEIDVESMLPADEVSHGFDNITVGELSPTLVSRYISAAQRISRLAIGNSLSSPDGKTFRIPPDVTQEEHVEGLPIGTRGGALISYTFPLDGEYEFQIRLARDRNEEVEGLSEPHEIELLVDQERSGIWTVKSPRAKSNPSDAYDRPTHENVDKHLKTRVTVKAGRHDIGVAFLKKPSSLIESRRQPLNVHYNMYRHPRLGPAVYQVSITGPHGQTGAGDTPSRQRIFVCQPTTPQHEADCAKKIVSTLMRRAFRQPIRDADLAQPMALYQEARKHGNFDDGIEMALSGVLVNPQFLFRVERDPKDVASKTAYRISDVELASRLSFFLWSSIPDDELLAVAERGELSDPIVLEKQTRRMLADPRSNALVKSFAGQWLYLRNLDSITPDARLYPDFDDNLRQAMRRETELFFESILREDRSVVDLVKTDYTYLNERLAKHYGIAHVYGSRFRRVSLDENSKRGGLLRQASVLTVTSYATRTSPVIRGTWILENVLGTPPPPPPPNVPALVENTVSSKLPVRERLAQHRADPACASCHNLMDPIGFALENFDAVGRWRDLENGVAVDATGGLPDGSTFVGVDGLEQGIIKQPEIFVGTMTEKLLTYAVGRGHEHFDAPAIRKIVRDSKADDFRFSSVILGIVESAPFQTRMTK